MKPLLVLLGLSLAANAALYLFRPAPIPATAPAATPRAGSSTSLTEVEKNSATSAITASVPANTEALKRYGPLWEKIRAGDPAAIAALRTAGWPEDAIRAFVIAFVDDTFRPRERALRPDNSKTEYWRQDSYTGWNADRAKAYREIAREKKTLLKNLIGDDPNPEPNRFVEQRFPGLNPAQVEAVSLLEEDYRLLTQEIRGTNSFNTVLLPEDREKLAFIEKERQADLAKILSPAQILELELRNSPTANNLRNQLTAFDPTEDEFRALFELQNPAAVPSGGMMSASQREAMNKEQAVVDAQVKQILSPERYADYIRAKDFEYRRLHQLSERLQLPKENAVAAYSVKQDIETRLREIRRTPGPDGAKAVAEARAALAREAEQRLVESLGERGFEIYKTVGASWLTRLTPPTPSPR